MIFVIQLSVLGNAASFASANYLPMAFGCQKDSHLSNRTPNRVDEVDN